MFILITLFISHGVAESNDVLERQLINSFWYAVEKGNVSKVKDLLSRGTDVNFKDDNGFTFLMKASEKGHTEIVKELMVKGADINAKMADGYIFCSSK